MRRVGDDAAGFSFTGPDTGKVLRCNVWGFWSTSVAETFARTMAAAAVGSKQLFVDATAFKPQRVEGQNAMAQLFAALAPLGLERVTVVTTNPLTRLQLLRIANESPAAALVQVTSK